MGGRHHRPAPGAPHSLRWLVYQMDYRLTREGIVYLAAVFMLVLAAVNTGNNLLFHDSRLPARRHSDLRRALARRAHRHRFALRSARAHFRRAARARRARAAQRKAGLPSFSLRVVGDRKKIPTPILTRPVFFPYIPRLSAARQKVELLFPHRGVYRQDAFGIRTRFPFGFFEKTREVGPHLEIVVYPAVQPTEQFYEILPLLSGEMASFYRGRGHELHSLRDYLPTDSARFVDWKVTARAGRLHVREFAREDERRVMLVFDPFVGPPSADRGPGAAAEHAARFERAVSTAASIAWHFHEINSVLQIRTDRFVSPMAPAGEIIYDTLRELAMIQPETSAAGGAFLDDLAAITKFSKSFSPRAPSPPSPPPSGRPLISSSSTASSFAPLLRALSFASPASRLRATIRRAWRHLSRSLLLRNFNTASSPGFASIAATFLGAPAAIPIASGSRK